MKKVLIFCLSAALLLVSLTACHKPQVTLSARISKNTGKKRG